MDIIRRYIPKICDLEDRHKACEQLMQKFMTNYSSIAYESESLFICKYFMSAILSFCADIQFTDYQTLETFIRFFVEKQSGIWDIWSVIQFEATQWTGIEGCLGFKLENLRHKTGFHALKYIIEISHKLNIEFVDPNDKTVKIRFIDFPRFDAIESKSELWRNLHLPIIDCTLLPESPHVLQMLLQFGAKIPTNDYQIQHLINRIQYPSAETSQVLQRKLFWIKFTTIDIPFQSLLYKELSIIGNKIIEDMKNEFECTANDCVFDIFPEIPSLKQMARYAIRNRLRNQNGLPQSIAQLEIYPNLKDYLNLISL